VDRDGELLLEEGDEAQEGDRIEDAALEERVAVRRQRLLRIAHQGRQEAAERLAPAGHGAPSGRTARRDASARAGGATSRRLSRARVRRSGGATSPNAPS